MRFLVTAIGSMSAECVIKCLKAKKHFVIGCDIYPGEWHYESKICDKFIRAPYATCEDDYIQFLLNTCIRYNLNYIIPLTDLEIDVINRQRNRFDEKHIILCMQTQAVLSVARNKFVLSQTFNDDICVPSIKTSLLTSIPVDFPFPCIAKPYNGRSSEGLLRNASLEQIMAIKNKEDYIIQEQITGYVYTVDYCRSAMTGRDVAIPRLELLRTKNGAGLTIQITPDENLIRLASHIGNALDINGCVNFEFILNKERYYLIDVNPRFSAGIAFSCLTGYDMIMNHIYCFTNKDIEGPISLKKQIMIKKYDEVIY